MSSTRRLGRDAVRVAAMSHALPMASAATIANRLPILAGLSPASAAWQSAELWRMTLEKPFAFWRASMALGMLPWQLWSTWTTGMARAKASPMDVAVRMAAVGTRGLRETLTPVHAKATSNARRLGRRSRR
jgi:hypothetical protein